MRRCVADDLPGHSHPETAPPSSCFTSLRAMRIASAQIRFVGRQQAAAQIEQQVGDLRAREHPPARDVFQRAVDDDTDPAGLDLAPVLRRRSDPTDHDGTAVGSGVGPRRHGLVAGRMISAPYLVGLLANCALDRTGCLLGLTRDLLCMLRRRALDLLRRLFCAAPRALRRLLAGVLRGIRRRAQLRPERLGGTLLLLRLREHEREERADADGDRAGHEGRAARRLRDVLWRVGELVRRVLDPEAA